MTAVAAVMCPVCGVPPGQRCIPVRYRFGGHVSTHKQRYAAAKALEAAPCRPTLKV